MRVLTVLIAILTATSAAVAATPPQPASPLSPAPAHPLVWDATVKEVKAKPGETMTAFTFWVTNTSNADASILSTRASCSCTVAQLPSTPWVLKPGASGSIAATMDVRGKYGAITKTVTLETSHGPQVLLVRSDVPLPTAPATPQMGSREMNQLAALSDRQAIFKGDCAKCHVEPTLGQTGEKLFVTACGICHTAEHRAAMVTDLAEIKTTTNAEYWRAWINHGKPGTLMAAFAKEHGGILDKAQVDSLVEYLVKAYPSKAPGATAAPAASPAAPPAPAPLAY